MRNTQMATSEKFVAAVVPYAGGAGAMTAIAVDGTGFGRVSFIFYTGTATATGTATWKIQSSATSGGSYADVTSATFTALDDTGGSKVYICDIAVDPAKPFMKVSGATATAAIANCTLARLYRPVPYPVATTYATQYVQL
jgi:hypothetical protein